MTQRILVWDIPTRLFHWLLVISFAGAFLTSESERNQDIHVVLGYTLLGLLAFRLLWGFVGTRYARFRSFLFKPGEIAGYVSSLLKGKPTHYPGHNPAGSLAIYALLALGIASSVSGVMLYREVGGEALEELHEAVSYGMLAVVVLHIGGVLVSSALHRENLVRAMISGYKPAQPAPLAPNAETGDASCEPKPEAGIPRTHMWLGVIMLAAVVAFWLGYPAIGLVQPGGMALQAAQHDDDD